MGKIMKNLACNSIVIFKIRNRKFKKKCSDDEHALISLHRSVTKQ
jgi:hypothetical protein